MIRTRSFRIDSETDYEAKKYCLDQDKIYSHFIVECIKEKLEKTKEED